MGLNLYSHAEGHITNTLTHMGWLAKVKSGKIDEQYLNNMQSSNTEQCKD